MPRETQVIMLKLTPPGGFGIPHQLFDANGKFVNDGTQKFFQDVVHAHETAGSWAISNFFGARPQEVFTGSYSMNLPMKNATPSMTSMRGDGQGDAYDWQIRRGRIVAVDQLGWDFLNYVDDEKTVDIKEDGTVTVQ